MEIENAVKKLSDSDLTSFRDCFLSFDALAWDLQFKEDVACGRLNALADETIADLQSKSPGCAQSVSEFMIGPLQ